MISAFPGGVIAVVGGEHQEVALSQGCEDAGQHRIIVLQRLAVANGITPVAKICIEIDEVGHDEAARRQCLNSLQRNAHQRFVACNLDLAAGAGVGKDVADLAYRDNGAARLGEAIQKRRRRRQHRIILAVAGADEIAGGGANEGARDDAADVQFIGQLAGNAANFIEPFKSKTFFMRGDLNDTIGTCIDNRFSGRHVFRAEFCDDLRAGGMFVCQNSGKPGLPYHFIGKRFGESWSYVGEITPVEGNRHAGYFPVTGDGVLAARDFFGIAPLAFDLRACDGILSSGCFCRKAKPKRGQIGNVQFHSFSNVDKGICAFIAIFLCIRRPAYTETVEYKKNDAAHLAMRSMTQGVACFGLPKT